MTRADVIAQTGEVKIDITENADGTGNKDVPADRSVKGLLRGKLEHFAPTSPVSPANSSLTLHLDNNTIKDLWIAVKWGS